MHDYSLDTDVRRKVHVGMATIALGAPAFFTAHWPFNLHPGLAFPLSSGTIFTVLYFLFDRLLWRCPWFPGVPDLNGEWHAHGVSSYEDPKTGKSFEFEMTVTIRQTFSRMEVFTRTSQSISTSFMASIEIDRAVAQLRYGYENVPHNIAEEELQRHSGMMDLRITSATTMEGGYYSGKHRVRYGNVTLTKKR